jgi:hypothetical protein
MTPGDPVIITQNNNITIRKVEYYLNKKLVSTKTAQPFTYLLDTKKMRNGEYKMDVKTTYSNGTVDTRTDNVVVKNKVDPSYVARHYGVTTISTLAILAVFGGLIWKLVLPKFGLKHASAGPGDDDRFGTGGGPGGTISPNGGDGTDGGTGGGPIAEEPEVVAPQPEPQPQPQPGSDDATGVTVSSDGAYTPAPGGTVEPAKPGDVIPGGDPDKKA